MQIGVRFMLPLVALGTAGLAAAAAQACASGRWTPGLGRFRWGVLVVFLSAGIGWMAVSAARVWPNGLCYTNEAWGGTENGYRCLSDSNYDWGQGLKELAAWQRERGLESLDVLYFGTDPALATLPMRKITFEEINAPSRRRNYLAVSTTILHGNLGEAPAYRRAVRSLSTLRPVARTSTFLIFDSDDVDDSLVRSGPLGSVRE